jgi:hypothetical protein
MTGQEIFTMGGEERFVKAIEFKSSKTRKTTAAVNTITKKQGGLKRVK